MLNLQGAEDISNGLENNRTLTDLNLRSNNLGQMGGLAIVNCLTRNKVIKALCLADNKIGNQVAILLSGRLSAGLKNLCHSVLTDELRLPDRYQL
jgi:hypothetical protein